MKQILLLILSFISLSLNAQQEYNSQEENQVDQVANNEQESLTDDVFSGGDIMISGNFDEKFYSMRFTYDITKYKNTYFNYGYGQGFGDISSYSPYVGFGLKKRYIIDDILMVSVHAGPYIGFDYSTWNTKTPYEKTINNKWTGNDLTYTSYKYDTQSHFEFTYGLMAEVKAGIKIGKHWGISGGYYMGAGKFDFDGFFKNGSWAVGAFIYY